MGINPGHMHIHAHKQTCTHTHTHTHTHVLHCIGLNCVLHSNSCVKILTPNVALFGHRTSTEVIKVE